MIHANDAPLSKHRTPDMIMTFENALNAWLRATYPNSTFTLTYYETDEQWELELDGTHYLAPVGSDDDALMFYNPDEVQSDEQEGIVIDFDELDDMFDVDWES